MPDRPTSGQSGYRTGEGTMPEPGQYRNKGIQSGLQNTDVGGIGPDADAQL
jgi:hypothetical protein